MDAIERGLRRERRVERAAYFREHGHTAKTEADFEVYWEEYLTQKEADAEEGERQNPWDVDPDDDEADCDEES